MCDWQKFLQLRMETLRDSDDLTVMGSKPHRKELTHLMLSMSQTT